MRALLAEQDGSRLAAEPAERSGPEAGRLRSALRSIGTCDLDEPLADLRDLRLLP